MRRSYELINGLQQVFDPIFQTMSDLRTAIIKKNIEISTVDFGGRVCGMYDYRFTVYRDCISFVLFDDSCTYTFHIHFDSSAETVISYSDSSYIHIVYGNISDRSTIRLIDRVDGNTTSIERSMDFPIHESQYFQLLTVQELASEEFYNELVNTSTDYMIGVHLSYNTGSDITLGNIINDNIAIYSIISDTKMRIRAYRTKHSI